MDYTSSVFEGMNNISKATSTWCSDVNSIAVKALQKRGRKGPISAKDAILIQNVLPVSALIASTPLRVVSGRQVPSWLYPPQYAQGLNSAYWNLTQGVDAASGKPMAVLFVLQQITVTPSTSAWSVCIGAVHPHTKKWICPPTSYAGQDQVVVTGNGIQVTTPEVNAVVAISAHGFLINAEHFASGLIFNVNATSARGPTYEQKDSNVRQIGVVQTMYWSMPDGIANSGSYITLDGTQFKFKPGSYSWMDNQQIGFAKMTGFTQMAVAAVGKPAIGLNWLYFAITAPTFQMNGEVTKNINSFVKKEPVQSAFNNNMWGKEGTLYDQTYTVQLLETYPGSTIPSKIQVTVKASKNVFVLTSYVVDKPYLKQAGGSGYESPATVSLNGKLLDNAFGVIEWVPKDKYPSNSESVAEAGLDPSILDSHKGDPKAQAGLAMSSILGLAIFLFIIVIIVCAVQNSGKSCKC